MKSRKFLPFMALAGVILLVGLACGTVSTPTAQPPIQVQPTQPSGQIQPTQPPPVQGQEIRQWAISAVASSQYGETGWSASQATGAPDTPDCNDHTTAWASASSSTVDWIELSYAAPVNATEVVIYQTFNPSSIVKVELIDVNGGYHEIYIAQPKALQCPQTLHISFQQTNYRLARVRITIDQSVLQGWNEIDAVELVGIGEASLLPTETQTTQAPTATQGGSPVYFTEEFDNDIPDWSYFLMNGDENKMTLESGNGILTFDLDGEDLWVYLLYDPYIYTDVRLDARVENRGFNNNNVSLICRYDENYGWYEFNIANSGLYAIYAYDELSQGYQELYSGGSTAIHSGKEVNEYTAICAGDTLALYINGVEAHTITERSFAFRDGKVGISTSSFDVFPIIVEWDWVTISEP